MKRTDHRSAARTLRTTRAVAVAAVGLLAGAPGTATWAQPTDDETTPVGEPFRLRGPAVQVELGVRAQSVTGQDGPDRVQRDLDRFRAGVSIDLRQQLTQRIDARAELQLRAEQASVDNVLDEDEQRSLLLRRLHLDYDTGPFRLRVGRQGLEDDTGFYIDEDVDGARLSLGENARRFDVSVSRQSPYLDGSPQAQNTLNALAALQFRLDKDSRWTPFVLYRSGDGDDGEDDADIAWYGVQGTGRMTDALRYWFNGGGRRGEIRRDDDRTRQLGGFGLDTGITWAFDRAAQPSLTIGLAHATGDVLPADGDDGFRQSGLHSNRNRFNGEHDFRHLGEVLDPELANITIATLGVGTRLTKDLSLDLVYHAYLQAEADDNLRGSDLEFDPLGVDKALGDGLDLIVGYDNGDGLEVQAVAGMFQPGEAFAAGTDDAWLLRLEIEYSLDVIKR